ncbi:MAG: DUF3108 domain-containing protein [Bacteroidota bacterium]
MKAVELRLSSPGRDRCFATWTLAARPAIRRGFFALVLVACSSFQFHPDTENAPPRSEQFSDSSRVSGSPSDFLQVGEELHYRVSFWFIGLGEIKLKLTDQFEEDGRTLYRAQVHVDSYDGNPFVHMHEFYQSEFDSSLYPRRFEGRWLVDTSWHYVKYDFQYDSNKVITERGLYDPPTVEKYDTVQTKGRYQDGLSLLYFARGNVGSGLKTVVHTFIKEKKGRTYFDFTNETDDQEIDSVSYHVDVLQFEGEANWVGMFGLTGGFKGWFSNDDARVPIVARMKVIIGSVKVQLQDWKREGWIPPRHIEDN